MVAWQCKCGGWWGETFDKCADCGGTRQEALAADRPSCVEGSYHEEAVDVPERAERQETTAGSVDAATGSDDNMARVLPEDARRMGHDLSARPGVGGTTPRHVQQPDGHWQCQCGALVGPTSHRCASCGRARGEASSVGAWKDVSREQKDGQPTNVMARPPRQPCSPSASGSARPVVVRVYGILVMISGAFLMAFGVVVLVWGLIRPGPGEVGSALDLAGPLLGLSIFLAIGFVVFRLGSALRRGRRSAIYAIILHWTVPAAIIGLGTLLYGPSLWDLSDYFARETLSGLLFMFLVLPILPAVIVIAVPLHLCGLSLVYSHPVLLLAFVIPAYLPLIVSACRHWDRFH